MLCISAHSKYHIVDSQIQVLEPDRGIAREYGVCFPLGIEPLLKALPLALECADNELTDHDRARTVV